MPILTVRGSWYGAGCTLYEGEYTNLGPVPDTNYFLEKVGDSSCGGFRFVVRKSDTREIIYNSTSSAKEVSLFFDGQPQFKKYDCLNAECIESTQYNTPGLYQSLEECEQACGPGCGGKCISDEKWSIIKALARKLINLNCSK